NAGNTTADETSGNFRDGNLVGFALNGPTSNYIAPGGVITGNSCSLTRYRSAATGNWESASTWEIFNGTGWVPASTAPSSVDGVITIRSPHVVTINASITLDQLVN